MRLNAVVSALLSAAVLLVSYDTSALARAKNFKYTTAQCDASLKKCGNWCTDNREGDEREKCEQGCINYYVRCMNKTAVTAGPGGNSGGATAGASQFAPEREMSPWVLPH